MVSDKLDFQVVTPERRVVAETVDEVVLPGTEGYLGVLPGHAPLLTSLDVGEIAYRQGERTHYLAVSGGFAEVLRDRVTVLAETCERAEEIDAERARRAKERAEGRIREYDAKVDLARAQGSLRRALCRLEVHRHVGS